MRYYVFQSQGFSKMISDPIPETSTSTLNRLRAANWKLIDSYATDEVDDGDEVDIAHDYVPEPAEKPTRRVPSAPKPRRTKNAARKRA